jgi:hypothetical protein
MPFDPASRRSPIHDLGMLEVEPKPDAMVPNTRDDDPGSQILLSLLPGAPFGPVMYLHMQGDDAVGQADTERVCLTLHRCRVVERKPCSRNQSVAQRFDVRISHAWCPSLRAPLPRLQSEQAARRFSKLVAPPADQGTM